MCFGANCVDLVVISGALFSNFHKNEHVSGAQNIAKKINECFTNIGPDLASSIDTANKAPFDSYLNTPCSDSFLFQYINSTGIAM